MKSIASKTITVLLFLLISFFSHAEINWLLQSQAPANNLDFKAIVKFAEDIRIMTGGRLIITPIAGDSQERRAKGARIYSAVKQNDVQMAVGWPNWWHQIDSAWNALQSGPYGLMNIDASMMWYFVGNGTQYANELANKDNIIWRPAWWAGMEMGLLTTQAVKDLETLKDKTIRIGPGIPNEVLNLAAPGVKTATIPSADITNAFASGRIDGIEWTTPNATYAMDFHRNEKRQIDHIIAPAVWQPSVLGDFLINQSAFEALPPDIQAILDMAMKAFALTTTLEGKVADMKAMENYQKDGIKLSTWSEKDLAVWKEQAKKVYQRHMDNSATFKKFHQDKMEFKAQFDRYYQVYDRYDD